MLNCIIKSLFADVVVGTAEARSALQSSIDIVNTFIKHWHFETNARKCTIVPFKLGKPQVGGKDSCNYHHYQGHSFNTNT